MIFNKFLFQFNINQNFRLKIFYLKQKIFKFPIKIILFFVLIIQQIIIYLFIIPIYKIYKKFQISEPERVSYILSRKQRKNKEIQNFKVGEVNYLDDEQVKQKIIDKEEKPQNLLKSKNNLFNYGEQDKEIYQRRPIAYEGKTEEELEYEKQKKERLQQLEQQQQQQLQVDSPQEIQQADQYKRTKSNKDVFMPFDQRYGFYNKQFDQVIKETNDSYYRQNDTITDEQLAQVQKEMREQYKRNKASTRTEGLFK